MSNLASFDLFCYDWPMKTKLFIDFDDTLFDRDTFKERLVSLIKKQGFSDEEVEAGYREVYKNNGYEGVWAHLEYLHQNVRPIDMDKAKLDINDLFSGAKELLFSDVLKFLNSLDKKKYEINLITVGGLEFQRKKVSACEIEPLFDNCYFTTEEKSEALADLVGDDESFVLLEDKDETIESVKKIFPKAMVLKAEKDNLLKNLKLINSQKYA